jgi:hypothetical protein
MEKRTTIYTRYDFAECWIGGVNHIKTWAIVRETLVDDEVDGVGDTDRSTLATVIGDRAEAERLVKELNEGAALFELAQRIINDGTDSALVAEARKALGWDEP